MKFKATKEQIGVMVANAVNASSPMGLGFLHATDHEFKPEEFDIGRKTKNVNLDYVQGRMVKLTIVKHENNVWESTDLDNPRMDYQSWKSTYNTGKELLDSAGITEIL